MEAAGEAGDDKSPSKTEPDDQGSRQLSVDQLRTLSIDKVTVEKIVLESSAGSREVLLTKNESSRRVSIKSEVEKPASGDNYRSSLPDDIKAFDGRRSKKPERIKPIRLTKSPSIGSLAVATGVPVDEAKGEDKENLLITEEEDKENLLIAKEEKVNARNLLERSQTNIEVLQRNLNTRIGASTAQRYKKKLLESRENRRPKFAGRIAFDEEFLQKHNLDKRLKIEEYGLPNLPPQPEEEEEGSSKAGYSEKVLEVEKRWSGEFLKNQLDRRSSESSKSSYVGEYGSVSSRESIAEDYDPRAASSAVLFQSGKEKFEAGRPISLNCAKTLAASTLSTLDSDSCLEDRIKSLEEDIEEDGDSVARRRIGRSSDPWRESMLPFEFWNRKETTESRIDETRNSRVSLLESTRVDGYASLIRKFTMEAGSSRSRKEEKQKRKLGFRRLLPGFFSPKDSRKDYKKKEGKERKRAGDDRHFARYQQNGNYARSADTMNLNEDIKRNVKLDNSLNGSMIEERLDEIKRELFPLDQGPITSTPDHLAREDQGGGGQLPARSYTTDSSLSSIAPDERWAGERSGQLLGVSPDARKFEQRQRQRYGQPLERKHSLQEPNHCAPRQQPAFFQRNHGPSGRISAPPAERYLARPRPVDRPLPAIPRSRLDLLSNYENYLEAGEQALYENENPPPGLILKSVSAQVKITRQPIVNQNQRAPLLGRSPKYLSSGSSQKSGDYGGESSCTPNSSQKSEFSPTSSKSGEYYLHSPRDTGSPNEEDSRRDEGIYENEKSPDERIYDETPCEEADSNLVEDKRGSPRRSRSRGGERAASPARGSAEKLCGEQGKAISPLGSRRPPSARRAQPNEQILIASPKRDVPYETRIPRPCNESRRCLVESPVHMTNAPRKLVVANSGQDSSDASKGQVSLEIPRPEPVYARQRNPEPASPEKKTNSQERKEGEERVAWVQASSSPQIGEAGSQKVDRSIEDHRQNSIPTMEPQPLQRNPNLEEQRVSNQLDSRQRSLEDGAQYNQRTYEATQRMGPLSPSKQETRQHLEAFYWQQKALEAHRKSLASPASEKQMGRKIDLPEVREAVYWQQLKKLDEEQQRRIYEQNPMDESSYCKAKRVSAPRQQGPPVRVAATGGLPLPVIAHHGNPSSWTCGNAKPSPGGKPPLMQSQKGQNQPVLIVRPQQAIRDPRVDAKPLDSVQRSKSASPHFHRGDVPQARKLEVSSSIYEEEPTNDVEGKAVAHPPPPPPIFKRGSLIGGESVEYGSGSGAKRVSFSNQSGVGGQELASGSWPTKHGTAPEPPTRRHRSEDSVSDTDSVFSYPDRLRDPSCEYDADRPLPPLPKDATRRGVAYNGDTTRCNVGVDPRRGVSPQRVLRQKEEEWNSDGKGRQSNDIGGSGREEGEAGSNEVPTGRRGGGGGGVGSGVGGGGGGGGSVLGVGGGGGSGSIGGGSGGRSGSGGGRSRDEPRRHTLGGDHQPSLHHQQFNAAQQLHPLHPHHLPPPHGQYGTPPTRHTTMDLEMGTKSRQRKSPLPRGYPPPSTTMLFDDDPGIMSEVETSSTGFRRGGKQRSSLPVVRTPSKTLERPLGLVFLQYRNETKRALLPNEITSIDTVKALFVRSFPKQLTMEYLDSPHVKVYIHDSNKDMFYELEDLRSHLRDIRDRSVLRLFESTDGVTGMPGPLGIPGTGTGLPPHWEDQSYFSEPEFDSEYQHQHIHKSKTAKNSTSGNSGYYVGGSSTLPRGGQLMRAYSPAASSVVGGPNATPTQPKPLATPDRLHGESGYMSSPERGGGVGSGTGRYPPGPYSAGSSYEDPYYSQYSGTVTPVIDEEARIRVEHMERQLANLTGLVQKALTHAPHTSPSPRDYLQVPAGRDPYARGPDKSVSFEKSVSFSDEPPDMNSPKQHSPQHAERDRHKPTPPPKPAALVAGQYVYRDMALTPEMYNQLRGLQKKAKDLRQEVRNLRRMSQAQAHTIRETILDTFITIRTMLLSCGDAAWDAEKIRLSREEDLYRQEMLRLVKDLTELENTVEELRGNVINRKTRVNMSDVENMALIMSKSSKTVADLKVRFPSLQEGMKGLLSSEMEMVVRAEKFLKEEPERLESALKRCKKLTSTLVTLKRLASVQEQRLPNAAASIDAEETPPITPTSAQHSKAAAPVPAERTVVGSASVIGGGPHTHEPPATHQQRPENALDALLDELQTFSRPSSQLGHTQGSSTMLSELGRSGSRGDATGATGVGTTGRPPCISDIGRKGSVDSTSGILPSGGTLVPVGGPQTTGGTLRRLHSYPSSSDTDTSPPIARLQVSLQEQPSLPTLPQGFVPGQKPPVPERNAELLQLASARRVPPPPPPRTSSRSPLASPTSPQLPPRNHSCNLQSANATLRRPPARGTLPVKEGKPPMALPTEQPGGLGSTLTSTIGGSALETTSSPVLHNNSTSSQSSAVLSTSNSSSCESVNSQEGLQSKKGRQEQLEQRHQELLRKQKALQEQYARLQQLQRNTAGLTTVPPAPPDLLKKTGSESNLLAKMGLGLSTASSGSLTSLTVKPSIPQEVSVDSLRTRQEEANEHQPVSTANSTSNIESGNAAMASTSDSNDSQQIASVISVGTAIVSTAASSGNNNASTTTTTTTSKIYETDIL